MMCERGVDDSVEHLILECERYEYAINKILELVLEDIGKEG